MHTPSHELSGQPCTSGWTPRVVCGCRASRGVQIASSLPWWTGCPWCAGQWRSSGTRGGSVCTQRCAPSTTGEGWWKTATARPKGVSHGRRRLPSSALPLICTLQRRGPRLSGCGVWTRRSTSPPLPQMVPLTSSSRWTPSPSGLRSARCLPSTPMRWRSGSTARSSVGMACHLGYGLTRVGNTWGSSHVT